MMSVVRPNDSAQPKMAPALERKLRIEGSERVSAQSLCQLGAIETFW
jgi:hypothetical protein